MRKTNSIRSKLREEGLQTETLNFKTQSRQNPKTTAKKTERNRVEEKEKRHIYKMRQNKAGAGRDNPEEKG